MAVLKTNPSRHRPLGLVHCFLKNWLRRLAMPLSPLSAVVGSEYVGGPEAA